MAKKKTFTEHLLAEVEAELREENLAKKKEILKSRLREIKAGEKTIARMKAQLQAELDAIDNEFGE